MKKCFEIISPRCWLLIIKSSKLLIVLAIIELMTTVASAAPSIKPEYRGIFSNILKNRKQYLIDTLNIQLANNNTHVLYDVADFTGNILFYAKSTHDAELLDGLAEVYLTTYSKLTSNTRYVYSYWPVSPYPYQSIHPLAVTTKQWLGAPVTIDGETLGVESVLETSQFLYNLAQLCNAITDISPASRTDNMNTFMSDFVPVILTDYYNRWIFAGTNYGVFQVTGWGGQIGLFNHKDFLQNKHDLYFDANPDLSYINVVTDPDMFIIAGVVEMLAANSKDSTNVPINSTFKADLLTYVALGSDLLSDRMVSSSLTNFSGNGVPGVNFEPGFWDDHADYYYSGYTGSSSPSGQAHSPADNVGWDIGHARRFVRIFGTLYDNKTATGQTFPSLTTMQRLANQLVYGAFNKDLNNPKTSNFMDGTNGWYRVDYGDTFPGYGPYGMSYYTASGGYSLWSKFNSDITSMGNAIWNKIRLIHTSDISGHLRDAVVPFQMQKYGNGNPNSQSGYITFDTTNKYLATGLDTDYLTPQGTIELWFNPDSGATADGYPVLIRKDNNNYLRLRYNYSLNSISLTVMENATSRIHLNTSANTISAGKWHHLVVTQDGTGAKVYINGINRTLGGTNSGAYWTTHLAGGYINISDEYSSCKGKIDDVRIYSKALTATEIATNYQTPRLMANWTFDAAGDQYYYNNSTLSSPGKVGSYCASFDGTSQYFRAFTDQSFASPTGSIELWFNPTDSGREEDLIKIGENSYEDYLVIRKKIDNTVSLLIEDGNVLKTNLITTATVQAGQWNHLAVSQDGTNAKIYVNGILSSTTGTNSAFWTDHLTVNDIFVGKSSWYWYKGQIDELQIYRGALSANDVEKDYLKGKKVYDRTFDWSTEQYYFFTAALVPEGKIGGGVSFNGTNQYFRSLADSNLSSATGTIQMWINPDDTTQRDLAFVTGTGSSGSDYLFVRKQADNKISVGIKDFPDSNFKIYLISGDAVTVGVWNHVAVTQDGTGVKIYINGILSTVTGTNSGAYWTGHIANPYIWCGNSAWNYYKGKIDELQVYNYALDGAHIIQEYDREFQSVRYEFDETQNMEAIDFVKQYYGTAYYGAPVVLDYNATDSLKLLQFLPSLITWQ